MHSIVRSGFAIAMLAALPASFAANANCRQYSRQLSFSGKLATSEVKKISEWTSACNGAINASAAKGRLILQAYDGGRWQTVKDGISTIVPQAGAGRYRLLVTNPYGIPFAYEAGLRYGIR